MKYDIFLSYASVDNTKLAEKWDKELDSWVMCFKVALQQTLDESLGRTSSAAFFLDRKDIDAGDALEDKIQKALDETELFVALVSKKGYFHEKCWCPKELDYFRQKVGANVESSQRIIPVLLQEEARPIWREKAPVEIKDFPFYHKNPVDETSDKLGRSKIDDEFLDRCKQLADQLAKRLLALHAMQAATGAAQEPASPSRRVPRGTVYLAAVPGDIEDQRTSLASALEDDNWEVIPKDNSCNPNATLCETESAQRMAGALYFVQILSVFPWKPEALDHAQHEGALKANKPVLRFRSDTIVLEKVANEQHRKWLQEHEVAARSTEQIARETKAALARIASANSHQAAKEQLAAHGKSAFVTLSVSENEAGTLGRQLAAELSKANIFSLTNGSIEEAFLQEDGFITVFGDEIYDRVHQSLDVWRRLCLKDRSKTDPPPSAVFLSQPPPSDKTSAVRVWAPRLRLIQYDDQVALQEFVNEVKNYRPPPK